MKFTIGDKIKIHYHDLVHGGVEIKTRQDGKVYKVRKENEKLGIDFYEPGSSDYVCHNNSSFLPLDAFATKTGAIKFEKVGDEYVNGI